MEKMKQDEGEGLGWGGPPERGDNCQNLKEAKEVTAKRQWGRDQQHERKLGWPRWGLCGLKHLFW